MKVVIVNDRLNAGGAERVLVNSANILYKCGVDVTVLLYLKPSALDNQLNDGIKKVYLNRKWRFDVKAMLLLKRQVKNADIVHIHSRYNLRYYLVAKYLCRFRENKIVFHEHVPGYKEIDWFTLWSLRKVDGYIGVQDSIQKWATEQKIVPANKAFFLPNIVDKPVKPIDKSCFTEKKILMVGNFRKIKNHLFAIEVLQALGTGYSLDLAGVADDEEYLKKVLMEIDTKGLQNQVKIINNVTNIYDILPAYHFALHPALNETGPLVLLEYMQAGLPFFSYNTGDVVQNIKDVLPEFILDNFNSSAWVEQIKLVGFSKEKRQDLQEKMELIVSHNYSEEKYREKLLDIYAKTLKN